MAKRQGGHAPLSCIGGLVFIVLLAVTPAIATDAPGVLTEADAVRLFLEQSPHARGVSLAGEAVAAAWNEERRLSNPALAYQREDAAGVRDEFLTIEQQIPLSGRRALLREAGEAAVKTATRAAENDLALATHALRLAFYEVLHREAAVHLLGESARRLGRIVEILAAREREGESAGYELLRAELELSELEIAAAAARGELAAARSRFGAFFDPAARMDAATLAGAIEPDDPLPSEAAAIDAALAHRADLGALRALGMQLEAEERAARRRSWPEPTLSAGWKRTAAEDLDDTGFVAGIALPLPIFDRGRFRAARANVERERAGLEAEILARSIRADVRAALAREAAAREAARLHGKVAGERAVDVRRIAELAYEEGETGILELLDAYRTSLAAEMRVLALRHEARRARIERARALGAEVTP